jgi:hypothetical protein
MKNLGKIAAALIFSINSFAGVSADVDQSAITPGNIVTFSLHVSDTRFQKPSISTLCGVTVLGTSSQTSVNGVNGKFTKTQTLSYSFAPEHSCTINPIEIKTDNGVVKTAPIKIDVRALSKDAKEKFSLAYSSEKQDVYVGEPFTVTLTSKIRRDMKVIDSKFEASNMNGFWIKKQQQEPDSADGDYVNTKIVYVLAAQKAGELALKPASMSLAQQVAANDFLGGVGNDVKWSRYLSNSLHVRVKPLPSGVDIVGSDVQLHVSLDKAKVNQNEAANVTLTLSGGANFEDIGALKPFVANVSVFEDDAKVDHNIKNGVYTSEYVKKIAFVGDKSFTIPPIEIKYFDTKTHEIKTLKSEALHVEVVGRSAGAKNEPLKIEKSEEKVTKNIFENFTEFTYIAMAVSAFVGFLLGTGLMLLKPFMKKEKIDLPVSNKDLKLLLAKLIEFKEDIEVREMIEILEKKTYLGEDVKIDKTKLQELRKKYKF